MYNEHKVGKIKNMLWRQVVESKVQPYEGRLVH